MKKQLLTLLFIVTAFAAFTQVRNLEFALQSGGIGDDQIYSVKTDENGNIYTVGLFQDTVDFDPGAGTSHLISKGLTDMFIRKLDKDGKFLWAVSFGNSDYDGARDLSIDNNGDLLITGFFADTVDFDPGAGISNLISKGSYDIFILKLDANGSFIWANLIESGQLGIGSSICSDAQGNVLITGQFSGKTDFDPDTTDYNITSNGNQDVFILKLDSNGGFTWVYTVGAGSSDAGRKISVDSRGNIYSVGFSTAGADFDPGSGITYLHPFQNSADIYLLKLSPNGNFLWVRGLMGLSSFDRPYDVKVDLYDNVYLTGCYFGTIDFDPSSTGTFNLSSSGAADIFIQKLDSSGNFLWARSMGSSGDDQGFALALDDSNNVYTSGYFEGTVDFDPDSVGTFNLSSNGDQDIFIQKLDSNGNFIWTEAIGGTGFDQTRTMLVDSKGSIFAAGYFESTVDFDPDTNASLNLSSNGGNDHFLIKINQCNHSNDSLVITSCSDYTSPSGKIWTQSGIYLDTIPNSLGCDSLLYIDLNVIKIDTSLTLVNHVKITANDSLASYQWIDCNNGNVPITGDTNRSFVATANGNYAVVLNKNGCVDTSECIQVLTVGIARNSVEQFSINLYPNPNTGRFTIEVDKSKVSQNYQIFNLEGSIIQEGRLSSRHTLIDLNGFGKGIYFFRLNESGISRKVVLIE